MVAQRCVHRIQHVGAHHADLDDNDPLQLLQYLLCLLTLRPWPEWRPERAILMRPRATHIGVAMSEPARICVN